jgi:hypothetical protein
MCSVTLSLLRLIHVFKLVLMVLICRRTDKGPQW